MKCYKVKLRCKFIKRRFVFRIFLWIYIILGSFTLIVATYWSNMTNELHVPFLFLLSPCLLYSVFTKVSDLVNIKPAVMANFRDVVVGNSHWTFKLEELSLLDPYLNHLL